MNNSVDVKTTMENLFERVCLKGNCNTRIVKPEWVYCFITQVHCIDRCLMLRRRKTYEILVLIKDAKIHKQRL